MRKITRVVLIMVAMILICSCVSCGNRDEHETDSFAKETESLLPFEF